MTLDKIFHYCPICKYKLQIESNKIMCSGCNLEYYTNPAPCNGVIIRKDDQILLVRRRLDPQKGTLDFPGGFIEAGENIETSIKREIFEELGCELSSLTYFKSYADLYTYKQITYHTLGIIYVGVMKENETITPGDDVSGFEFININAIPYEQISFKSVEQALKEYISSL